MMKVLITGSEGVIGKYVTKKLKEKHQVIGLDVEVGADVLCDIRDTDIVSKVIEYYNPDVIVHLAALAEPAESFSTIRDDIMINLLGTVNILRAMKENMRIIFSSSCAVYGNAFKGVEPVKETEKCEPVSPYGMDKLASEGFIKLYWREKGIHYTIFRLGNVYSPYDNKYLLYRLWNDTIFKMYGEGEMVRDFVYVGDVCDAIEMAIDTDKFDNVTVNLGHEPFKIKDIVLEFKKRYGKPEKLILAPKRFGEFDKMALDTSLAKSIGWSPKVKLIEKGMEMCVNAFRRRCDGR